MSSLPPLPPDIQRTVGPLIVGYLLHWGLFGTLSTQVYMYFIAFPSDPWGIQVLVYGVYIAEVIQTILLSQSCFRTFATGFGDINAVIAEGNLWFSVPIMSSCIAAVVQAFYAYRISILARSYILPGIILFLSLLQLGGGLATGIIANQSKLFTDFLGLRVFISTGLWNGASAACDVLIAAGMTYYLSRTQTQWRQTRQIVQKLIRLIIETGTLTATIAIINLILSLLPGKPTYFQATSGILGKMYSTTMMVVFNSRMKILGGSQSENSEYISTLNDISLRKRAPSSSTPDPNGVLVTQDQFTVAMDEWPVTVRDTLVVLGVTCANPWTIPRQKTASEDRKESRLQLTD
ncbi:hypothetical protein CVT26_007891 [Gymnopilus dilepis]|uniref:DUF6534 domain-containing protein n=1 Tax=Gymnopilus dilepis TaxID=231916 RepID=A0A409YKD4_9AGAR|nr:hypothetical protein CVT26_007891 [Gymnopilus dilepis]